MSHFGDYIDGVPVKISEKYKRPPKIELPYSVSESPIRGQHVVESIKYCSIFEKNILSKLKELKSAKETKKNERRHRLQLLEEAKQKKLDAIAAAEAEERLKQLNVSEVSYPSTDELSALSPDEKNERNCNTNCQTIDNVPEEDNTVATETEFPNHLTQETTNILQPTQIQSNYPQGNLLDDPDPLQGYKINASVSKMPQSTQNVDMLTFKDFENDTSSPFDNVELKTMNDMELLAQVLQSQRVSSTNIQQPTYPDLSYSNCGTQAQVGVTYLPNLYADQGIPDANVVYTSPQHYPVSNGYYMPENICDNTMPMDNIYVPNYQYFIPQPYSVPTPYYNTQIPSTSGAEMTTPNGSTYLQQPYYYQCPPAMVPYIQNTYGAVQEEDNVVNNPSACSQNTVKSRSRSVPDIVKELNDELMSARQRATERSCNTSPCIVNVPPSLSNSDQKDRSRNKSESLPNPFENLSIDSQNICKKIHGMGFPLDRVARVCSVLGGNDKRIIECLLIIGELMDLGFTETRVSAALAKHEFNREKALDDLVS